MDGAVSLSKFPPALRSMDYEALRLLGLEKIQELAGQLWTDYNSHDPGITMLEVFSYVLTDLGYRVNYDIKDILAQSVDDPTAYDIKNFYTARQILPTCPLTLNDYRKLLMDVELVEAKVFPGGATETVRSGVKNAWIYCSQEAEQPIYVDEKNSVLSLDPLPQSPSPYYVKTLYDVLLEFDENDWYGDLNATTYDGTFVLYEHAPEPQLVGLKIYVKIEFPRWDESEVDWEDVASVQRKIKSVMVKINAPDGFTLEHILTDKFEVALSGSQTTSGGTSDIDGLAAVVNQLNNFIYHPGNGLIAKYVERVRRVFDIIEEVKATLHANRNLCDDFYRFSALKVEEIILCTDLELTPEADINRVEAAIFQTVADFLSPTVYFYTIEELLNKCKNAPRYPITEARANKRSLSVEGPLTEAFNAGDTLSIEGAEAWRGEYTIRCVRPRRNDPQTLDIEVEEDLPSGELTGDEVLFYGTVDETLCLTVDQIFEGPRLKHGFIDDAELEAAKRRRVIHVSDLIQLIMDVEGVVAVKSIQIANRPQDNDTGIPSQSVRWCLDLAFAQNYVPRLNREDSVLTYYKGQLPFLADAEKVAENLEALADQTRTQKIYYPEVDIPVPQGEFKDLESYTSLQEDLPQVYGVGSAGIPGLSSLTGEARDQRLAQAHQLKGFLLFFDQLMANYLSQLHHVKDLFSMNGDQNQFGEYQIDRTYFSQSLQDIVPDAEPLYVDAAGHLQSLRHIVEDDQLYYQRRNKFLDHLLGRFAETFTDYALLLYRTEGARAAEDLVEDKLQFLAAYPELSAGRGKGLNYQSPCHLWHVDNLAGLVQRASLLTGMAPRRLDDLVFRPNFRMDTTGSDWTISVTDDALTTLLRGSASYPNETEARYGLELLVLNGVCRDNYRTVATADGFRIDFYCGATLLATSEREDYASPALGGDADVAIDALVTLMEREFYTNHEANRKNLSMPLLNYFEYSVSVDMTPEVPTFSIDYTLYDTAFEFTPDRALLTGSIIRRAEAGATEAVVATLGAQRAKTLLAELALLAGDRRNYQFQPNFQPYPSPYQFVLCDRRGEIAGTSVAQDFNEALASEIKALVLPQVMVRESTALDGTYDIVDAVALGPRVRIEVAQTLTTSVFDGQLEFTATFNILSVDPDERSVEVDADLRDRLRVGDTLTIDAPVENAGTYTLRALSQNGSNTVLHLQQPLAAAINNGSLSYTKRFEVVGLDTNSIVIAGGLDERAVQTLIDWMSKKFLAKEGMHLIEHTLLRPRTKGSYFLPLVPTTLGAGLDEDGGLSFERRLAIQAVRADRNEIVLGANISSDLANTRIRITGGSLNDGFYEVTEVVAERRRTMLTVAEDLLFTLPDPPYEMGELVYTAAAPIKKVNPDIRRITIKKSGTSAIAAGSVVEILGSSEARNDRQYRVESIRESGANRLLFLHEYLGELSDPLLPIHLDQDCQTCQQTAPYSCIVTVVLPYWAGRFPNLDLRKFIEKTIRTEAPAHLLLNICWIDCEQMELLETRYKAWLVQVAKKERREAPLAQALGDLIDILSDLRNVYPVGTLHDCAEDDGDLEGAIVLNNSLLGTF